MGSVTSWFMKSKPASRMCAMFSSDPVSRLSTQITRCPSARRRSQRCDPRNPAPPVTTDVGIRTIVLGALEKSSDSLRIFFKGWSAEVLVRLHVEPHRKQRELAARDEQERDEHDRCRRDVMAADPLDRLHHAEHESNRRHHEAERVEEDERMEVSDDVLLAQPPEEALPEEPRDARHHAADLDPRPLADA